MQHRPYVFRTATLLRISCACNYLQITTIRFDFQNNVYKCKLQQFIRSQREPRKVLESSCQKNQSTTKTEKTRKITIIRVSATSKYTYKHLCLCVCACVWQCNSEAIKFAAARNFVYENNKNLKIRNMCLFLARTVQCGDL